MIVQKVLDIYYSTQKLPEGGGVCVADKNRLDSISECISKLDKMHKAHSSNGQNDKSIQDNAN